MREIKMRRKNRLILTVFAVVIILAMVLAYAIPFAGSFMAPIMAYAEDEPTDPTDPPDPPAPIKITITNAPSEMKVGDSVQLSYSLTNADPGTTIQWGTGDRSIALIDSSGKVVAVKEGTVEIFASVGDIKNSVIIKITPAPAPEPKPEEPEPVVTISIKNAPETLKVKEEVTLSYELSNAEAGTVVEWKSSDTSVAMIDTSGKVVAVAVGTVEISANVGEVKASVLIQVKAADAEAIKIHIEGKSLKANQKEVEIKLGEVYKVTATIEPPGGDPVEMTWAVSDETVLKFTEGELIGLVVGTADLTVTAGELTETLHFTVKEGGIPIAILVLIIVLIVIVITLILIFVNRNKKKKLALEEAARRRAKERRLKEETNAAAASVAATESEKQNPEQYNIEIDQSTKIYGGTSVGAPEVAAAPEPDADNPTPPEPEKPFSLDDID